MVQLSCLQSLFIIMIMILIADECNAGWKAVLLQELFRNKFDIMYYSMHEGT